MNAITVLNVMMKLEIARNVIQDSLNIKEFANKIA
jgi:hypothetical protein